MPTLIIAPDLEDWLVDYLATSLAARPESYASGVSVSIHVPVTMPARLVVVRRDGGPQLDRVFTLARVTFQVWAGTDADATDLALMVSALVVSSPNGSPVVRATATGPARLPPERDRAYRSLTAALTIRGTQFTS